MKKVALGCTGLSINPLVFGTLPLGPLQASLSPEEGGRLIRYALERGVNLLDTAELYQTYPHIRAALAGFTGEVHIATKTHANTAQAARGHVERALTELAVERLDIVHLHGARVADPFVERPEVIEVLLRMKEEGKIAHVGLSSHFVSAMRKSVQHPEIEVVHPLINRTGMGIIDGSQEEMAAAIAACAAAGKGVYAMKALAGGNLISTARESLRYVLGLAGVHGIALGMLSEAEIDGNLALFQEGRADEALWNTLEGRRRKLTIMEAFCKGCGACVPACTNNALSLVDGRAKVDDDECILCGYCGAACPEFMIRVV
ncbi:aldo/keto reductase [Geomonas sp. Red69]|uniref:aldo/keto reductase n=1 Tax=Geomonas diazotrophica TaxID=2843197 RepID=UPI001C1057D9|nr:aldo/keto reductase [Geomonas diazotrophica]MBU5636385.1 aldo/keto reductase [Geomonas diazotrophica]